MSVTIAESSGYDHKTEVERLLDADETVLSRLWQYENLGLTPQEMSDLEGVAGVGWVSNYRSLVRVLRDGHLPKSPSRSLQGARRIRSWLRKLDLSPDSVPRRSLLLTRC
jgi:hypothetical protein